MFSQFFFVDQWFVVNYIPWLIGVEMKEKDNDNYLEILSRPLGQTTQFFKSNQINILFQINF
jgi:hypothetical protein